MAITPNGNHVSGNYPDTVRHITNGDPANQTFLRNPMLDLEYRTDVLKDELNSFETSTAANFSDRVNFDLTHLHDGSQGEEVLGFARVYANGGLNGADFNLLTSGKFIIRPHGTSLTPPIFEIDEAGTDGPSTIKFTGSAAMFAHVGAAATDRTTNPHNLRLATRLFLASAGCLVGTAADSVITLNPAALAGTTYAAPGLVGAVPSNGSTGEGIMVGAASPGSLAPTNLVLIHDASTDDLLLSGAGHPIYGQLTNTGTQPSPIWQLSFFTSVGAYTFPALTPQTLKLYALYAYSLTTVPLVDPRLFLLAMSGVKAV